MFVKMEVLMMTTKKKSKRKSKQKLCSPINWDYGDEHDCDWYSSGEDDWNLNIFQSIAAMLMLILLLPVILLVVIVFLIITTFDEIFGRGK